jgi:1,4-dihydroxy-2-naphthoate octaprenyltransferase
LFGVIILTLLLISGISIILYSPLLANWGVGELIVGLNFGPFLSVGVFYIQTQTITIESILVGLVLGFLTAAILYINEFPDHDADKAKGRYHLVVRLGKKKAVTGYIVLMMLIYALILVGVILSITPPLSIIALFSLPFAINASRILNKNYNSTMELIPGMASTIMCTLITGILLFIAYVIHGLLLVM